MFSLFVSNTDTKVTSNNGSKINLSLNPPIILDPNKKWYAAIFEMDVVYCFANIFTGVNDQFKYREVKMVFLLHLHIHCHKEYTPGKQFKR